MPNPDGYHDQGFILAGKMVVWHHCKGAEHDQLVSDTPRERIEHLRSCNKRQRKEAQRIAKQNHKRRLEALEIARRMRAMA